MPPFARKVVSRNASTASESQDTEIGKLFVANALPSLAFGLVSVYE